MTIDLHDEIMQDFLVEAGEILETLNAELVDLEQSPEDENLLNSIFRGFHTIKGGASFLSLTNLVEICHKAEDVFNLLRNHELALDAQMMDTFLRVLDEVNHMFAQIRAGEEPPAAPAELLAELLAMQARTVPEARDQAAPAVAADPPPADGQPAAGAMPPVGDETPAELSDAEFDELLDTLEAGDAGAGPAADESTVAGTAAGNAAAGAVGDDEIDDDEFEALLDQIHGAGKAPTVGPCTPAAEAEQAPAVSAPEADTAVVFDDKNGVGEIDDDEIDDDEFEALLDRMHGKGECPVKPVAAPAADQRGDPVEPPAAASPVAAPRPAKSAATKAAPTTTEASVRVDTARLDRIMNLVGELVLARNRLNTLKATFEDEQVHQAISNLDIVTGDLQAAVMKTRMQPVKKVFGRFPRVVRDLARNLKKEVHLEMVGEDTDLDKNLVEALADPLVHLVRNSVDHGIELPEVREAAGKPREGNVVLAAEQEGDNILLSITDDGAGMDPEILRAKVVEKGLLDAESASRLDDKGCFDLIFMPGLTTKQAISDVSGRGVGMDVVKTKITQLNGSIDIESAPGKGTRLIIKVPLTLAILPTLMIQLGKRKYALPLSSVSEIFELSSKRTSIVDGREVVLNRGKAPPVFNLRKWLLNGSAETEPASDSPQVIMVQVANDSVGLIVDQVIGQEEVVIKPLGALLQGLPGMAGSTITGDGNIAIILDVQGLLQRYA